MIKKRFLISINNIHSQNEKKKYINKYNLLMSIY